VAGARAPPPRPSDRARALARRAGDVPLRRAARLRP
jgi:hypothetical protein